MIEILSVKNMTIINQINKDNILDLALKLFEEDYICDHCLGRQFSKILTGYSNYERGKSIRIFLMMLFKQVNIDIDQCFKNENVITNLSSIKNKKCWVCQDIFLKLDYYKDLIKSKLSYFEYNTFLIGTKLNGLLSENEEILCEICTTEYSEPLKSEINRELGKLLSLDIKKDVDFINPDILITLDLNKNDIDLFTKQIYIYGKYNRYERGISQTKWTCKRCNGKGCSFCLNTGYQCINSVEKMITKDLLKYSKDRNILFHGCGREDSDALMLGTGRPFVLEIKNPIKRIFNLTDIENNINKNYMNRIKVNSLSFCTKSMIKFIKTEQFKKEYELLIKFDINNHINIEETINNSIYSLSNCIIHQRTPSRVSNRRADIIREKNVYSIKIEVNNIKKDNTIKIKLICDGGLYVKELVSGDNNRTVPNLSSLTNCKCHVIEFNVLNIIENKT